MPDIDITPEAAALASSAWDAMLRRPTMFAQIFGDDRGPMLPAIALDMVQDATGERADARHAIVQEARRRIRELYRGQVEGEREREDVWGSYEGRDDLYRFGRAIVALGAEAEVVQMVVWNSTVFDLSEHERAYPDPRGEGLLRIETYYRISSEANRILVLWLEMLKAK